MRFFILSCLLPELSPSCHFLHLEQLFFEIDFWNSVIQIIEPLFFWNITESGWVVSFILRFSCFICIYVFIRISFVVLSGLKCRRKISVYLVLLFVSRRNWRTSASFHLIHFWSVDLMIWVQPRLKSRVGIVVKGLIVSRLISIPWDGVHLIHDQIESILIFSLFLPEHFHFVLKLFKYVGSIKVIIFFEKFIFVLKLLEYCIVLLNFYCEFIVHLKNYFVLFYHFFFQLLYQKLILCGSGIRFCLG